MYDLTFYVKNQQTVFVFYEAPLYLWFSYQIFYDKTAVAQ